MIEKSLLILGLYNDDFEFRRLRSFKL